MRKRERDCQTCSSMYSDTSSQWQGVFMCVHLCCFVCVCVCVCVYERERGGGG